MVNNIYTPQYLHFRLRAARFQKSNHHVYVHQAHRIFEINLSSFSSLKYQINNMISEAFPENNTSYFKKFCSKNNIVIHDGKFMNILTCLNQMVKIVREKRNLYK